MIAHQTDHEDDAGRVGLRGRDSDRARRYGRCPRCGVPVIVSMAATAAREWCGKCGREWQAGDLRATE
jgi:ribosomal protein S27AE